MNRDLQKLLQEKWFLVAADFIAVIGVLCIGFNPKDGFEAFLAVVGILGASLIVVIPVLKEGGGKGERQAEQARLRAALAEEIDRLRDDIRATAEAGNRRTGEVELEARKQAEAAAAAATAIAQRASAEINTLKAALAELEKKVALAQQAAAVGGQAQEALEEMGGKVDALAETVRTTLATAEEVAEVLAEMKAAGPGVTADDLKAVRDEVKKAGQKSAQLVDKLADRQEALHLEVQALRDRPAAPAPALAAAEEDVADDVAEEEEDDTDADGEVAVASAPSAELADEPAAAPTVVAGGTALVINLMIGIGNKPYVRGSGPGLGADKGVPMNFLGIGRWQWVCPDPEASATVEVWKNDEAPLGEPIHLSGGESVELDEGHFTGA